MREVVKVINKQILETPGDWNLQANGLDNKKTGIVVHIIYGESQSIECVFIQESQENEKARLFLTVTEAKTIADSFKKVTALYLLGKANSKAKKSK